ncbi:hypothetical protein BD410DRAFT_847024 [Rickenella mellea]|uniref:Uncharacterized protein n=1 Tax=Rickenella mellea TaxID=50990 RepID=A0A4Y7PDL3_9AGAM|nr:hypothetical protein BD410DRAFT_847024 [Rickenella mellea]
MPSVPNDPLVHTFKKLLGLGSATFTNPPYTETDEGLKTAWLHKASGIMAEIDAVLPSLQGDPTFRKAFTRVNEWRATLETIEASTSGLIDNIDDLFDDEDEDMHIPVSPARQTSEVRVEEALLELNPMTVPKPSPEACAGTAHASTISAVKPIMTAQYEGVWTKGGLGWLGDGRIWKNLGVPGQERPSTGESFFQIGFASNLSFSRQFPGRRRGRW